MRDKIVVVILRRWSVYGANAVDARSQCPEFFFRPFVFSFTVLFLSVV